MKISIIIPAYNEEKYIPDTLASVKQLDTNGWDIDLIVVDGGSKDKTASIAQKHGARVLRIPHRGIGFARQQGILQAKGEIIAFTDADTIVPRDWLTRHVSALCQSGVVFSYGTFRVTDGSFPYFHYINYMQPHVLWWFHHLFHTPIAAGQNLAFWKEKALQVGGFDDHILVMEDTDLAIRISKIGKVKFIQDLVVISSGRRSNEGWQFFLRMTVATTQYFILGRRSLGGFPDFR